MFWGTLELLFMKSQGMRAFMEEGGADNFPFTFGQDTLGHHQFQRHALSCILSSHQKMDPLCQEGYVVSLLTGSLSMVKKNKICI